MKQENKFQLLLETDELKLKDIANLFSSFTINLQAEFFTLQRKESPIFTVTKDSCNRQFFLNKIDETSKKKVREVKFCQAIINVTFENFEEVLQEYHTLFSIEETLLLNLGGILLLNWNGKIFKPEDFGL